MLKVNSCILHASSSVRGSSLNYCTCPGLNGILFPSCLSWPWFIGYTMLWERLCLLQQSLYAIRNTQIATRAAGSGPLPEDEQLLVKSSTAFPKSMGMHSGWPCSLMARQDCWGGQGAHGATTTCSRSCSGCATVCRVVSLTRLSLGKLVANFVFKKQIVCTDELKYNCTCGIFKGSQVNEEQSHAEWQCSSLGTQIWKLLSN